MSLLEDIRRVGVTPNVISFNAAISACEKGGQWQQTSLLLVDMGMAGVTLEVISFTAAISACEKGEQWQWQPALFLLDDICDAVMTPV